MQRCVEDDCRRAEVWCFQLQRQPVDAGKSYNHGGQPQFLLQLPFAARPRSCRHLFLQEGDGGGWASPMSKLRARYGASSTTGCCGHLHHGCHGR
ncbi:hypothetical protein VPH35_077505 [Triticum aestivum]